MIIKKFACKIDDIFSIKPQLRIFITFDDGTKILILLKKY